MSLKLLRDVHLAKRLGISGLFDRCVDDVINGDKPNMKKLMDEGKEEDLTLIDINDEEPVSKRDNSLVVFLRNYRKVCFFLVRNPLFDLLTFSTILTSSVFLCLEPPHSSMATILTWNTLRRWDMVFNSIFCVEALAKIGAFGFYTPRSIVYVSYLQVTQNRIDLLVLILALVEMAGGSVIGSYIGGGTMKMVRLMKVLRPVRLLMRSEGLKTIIEALVACRKPIFYATLFLLIVCAVFAVWAMALFKKLFYSCSDKSFDGLKGQGEFDCVSSAIRSNGILMPRVWDRPQTGAHFDTFDSAVLTLMRVLTLSWCVPLICTMYDACCLCSLAGVQM